MDFFYWLGMFLGFPKKDRARGGGCIRDWGVIITHVYSIEARTESR
jgi:hypothetical protein